jgi:tetratricopeptide (TPR) repeat protein
LGKDEQAVQRLEEAAGLNHQNREFLLEGHSRAALGDVWRKKGDLSRALECYEASLAIRRQIGDRKGEGWMLYHKADIFAALNEGERAKESSALAIQIALEVGDDKLNRACQETLKQNIGGSNA